MYKYIISSYFIVKYMCLVLFDLRRYREYRIKRSHRKYWFAGTTWKFWTHGIHRTAGTVWYEILNQSEMMCIIFTFVISKCSGII